jgi:hypothetical protein
MRGLFLLLVALLVGASSQPGPDYEHYAEWPTALAARDPNLFSGPTLSPAGFPLCHWLPGTGVCFALPTVLAGIDRDRAARGMQAVLALFLLVLLTVTLNRLLSGNMSRVVFALGLLLGATNLGYYAAHTSSEILACVLVIGATLLLRTLPEVGPGAAALLGLTTAAVLIIRTQAVLAMLPAGIVLALRLLDQKESPWTIYKYLLMFTTCCLLGLPTVLQHNYWMTGNYLHTPLAFGSGTFHTISHDLPYLYQVFWSSTFGLIRFHAVSLLGVGAALVLARRQTGTPAVGYHLSLVFTFLAQVWLIANWFTWSGGISFGARYFLPLVALLVLPVVELVASLEGHPPLAVLVLLLAAAAAYPVLRSLVPPETAASLAGMTFFIQLVTFRWRTGLSRLLDELQLFLGLTLILGYLGRLLQQIHYNFPSLTYVPDVHVLGLATLLGLLMLHRRAPAGPSPVTLARALALGALTLLAVETGLLLRFFPAAESYRQQQLRDPAHRYTHMAPFDTQDFRQCLYFGPRLFEMNPSQVDNMRKFWVESDKRYRIARPSARP